MTAHEATVLCLILSQAFAVWVIVHVLLRVGAALWRRWRYRSLPGEAALLQWLMDRAAARSLGVSLEHLRARRRIDGLTGRKSPPLG